MCLCAQLCSTLCDPMDCSHQSCLSRDFPLKNTGVGSHSLLQGIFPTQQSNHASWVSTGDQVKCSLLQNWDSLKSSNKYQMYNFSLTICKMSNLHSQVSMMIEKWLSHLENLCKMTFSIEERALEFSNSRFGWCLHILYYLPDILECQDNWVLRIITRNKATGGDGTPVELFKILKYDNVKVLHLICQ